MVAILTISLPPRGIARDIKRIESYSMNPSKTRNYKVELWVMSDMFEIFCISQKKVVILCREMI